MHSFRRFALLLALVFPAMHTVPAQSSSSTPPTPATGQDQAQPQETPQQQSVQARIRARREKRRADAIQETYSHRFEAYGGMGYLRFQPGPQLQRLTFYSWETGLTRNFGPRLGVNVEGRGYYGTAYVGLNPSNITRPSISQYDLLGGPQYRFYEQPKYSFSGRVMGGFSHGKNSADTNGFGAKYLGLYPDGNTFAVSASAFGEYNVTPNVAVRLGPEYFITGFGSKMQNSVGFNGGFVYRFGKP